MAHMISQPKEVLWNRNYIAVCTANFLLFFSFYLLLPMLPFYLRDTFAADKQLIGIILSGYTVTALLIRPFGGFIVDSFPRKTVLLICYFAFFIFFAGYLIGGAIAACVGFAFGIGAPSGVAPLGSELSAEDCVFHSEQFTLLRLGGSQRGQSHHNNK